MRTGCMNRSSPMTTAIARSVNATFRTWMGDDGMERDRLLVVGRRGGFLVHAPQLSKLHTA